MGGEALAVSFSGAFGGAERALLGVAAGLREPPLLACPEGPLAAAARERGLGVFELPHATLELRRSLRDRGAAAAGLAAQAAALRGLATTQRPAALLAWGMRAGLVAGLAWPRGPAEPLVLAHNDLLPGPLVGRAVRRVAARAARVVACSQCVARDLDPGGSLADRLAVVHPGVDLDRFAPTESPARDEILVLGAIERWKRPDFALEAFALAAPELPGLRLRIAGAPLGKDGARLLGELRERAGEPDLAGRVSVDGSIGDPAAALAGAACLLHAAEREPYGLVVAEALACGTPVVAPGSCGPAEIAGPAGGLLYEPGDPSAAARALVELLGDGGRAAELGATGRVRAEAALSLAGMQERWERVMEEATPRGARAAAPAPPGAGLSVVTVLHDSERELAYLLASLERHLPGAQVVVVDSGSADGGAALARRWRDGAAEVVEMGENVGFGRAVNAGIALAARPVTAVLNPDVELPDASLEAAALEALRPPERLLAPVVLRPDGSREANAQRDPGSAALLPHALLPGVLLPRRIAAAIEPWRSRRPSRAGWPVASCLVACTETLRRLGPFDESVFMYAEDLDLGLRASDAGVETVFWPAARVRHAGAHSTRRAFGGEPFELLARRRREVVRKRRGHRRARADDLLQLITFSDRLLLKRLGRRDAGRERRQIAALVAAMRDGPDGRP